VSETLAALGASVVLASRNAPELDEVVKVIKRAGGHALAQTADIGDERQVRELALATTRWVGPASILANTHHT
jgi:NAD(P)-dependent dehydrogenase (short-subunit alcohol dehydrogenase family)